MDNNSFSVERLLIGATGSIGVVNLVPFLVAFKVARFAKEVRIILTDTAAKMVPPSTVRLFCDGVYTELMDEESGAVRHIELGEWADVFAVLPASANTIAKAAHGICDDLLSTAIVAARCPVVFYPNMNLDMFQKPVVQRNLRQLEEDGHYVISPTVEEAFEVAKGEMVRAATLCSPSDMMKQLRAVFQLEQKKRKEGI